MTLGRLAELACNHFKVSIEDFTASGRKSKEVMIARHCFRTAAWAKYGFSRPTIAKYENRHNGVIGHSIRVINIEEKYEAEYKSFLGMLSGVSENGISVVVGEDGIERVTNDAFDERFYRHPTKINYRTGLPYFPAYHYITGEGAPTPFGLIEWYKQMGYKSNEILHRSAEIGSFVHDTIDRMIKYDDVVSHDEIHAAFPVAIEAQKIKECLWGFLNFVQDEEPIFLTSERMVCGEDYGLTEDNEMRIKSDGYKHRWASDWKTSKSATDDHKMQAEVIRRTTGCDRAMIVVLGNSTKKKYTISKVPENRHDYYWDRFVAIKETAYVDIIDKGKIKPREDNMPPEFSLKNLKLKRKL